MTTSMQFTGEIHESSHSDAQLMKYVHQRKAWALEVLLNRYMRRGIRQAQNMGLDYQTGEDIVLDAFMKIWNQSDKFQAVRGSFCGWFYTIVHNLAIDEIRRLQSRSAAQVKSYMQSTAGGSEDNQFSHELERIQVRTALKQLPEQQRQLIQLAYVEGLSRREIAKRLALPVGTVHTRVRSGKEKLKRLL